MKSLFELYGGTYTMQGNYHLPNLTLLAEEERTTGALGQRLRYYEQHHKALRYDILISDKLSNP